MFIFGADVGVATTGKDSRNASDSGDAGSSTEGIEGPTEEHGNAGVSVEIGCSSRAKGSVNEDAYLVDADRLLFGVFDGLGATTQAAQAAGLAADAIRAAYQWHGPGDDCEGERVFLLLAVGGAGILIATTLEDGLTTASVVKVCNTIEGVATALICSIGDSRVHRYTTGACSSSARWTTPCSGRTGSCSCVSVRSLCRPVCSSTPTSSSAT